jgi:hypothetical protein
VLQFTGVFKNVTLLNNQGVPCKNNLRNPKSETYFPIMLSDLGSNYRPTVLCIFSSIRSGMDNFYFGKGQD